jgi:predicted negative regulator of RcsB-dependent stress response
MALDLKDEKDINDKFSEFFIKNKRKIILYSIIFIIFYFASSFYMSQDEKKQLIASDLYQRVQLINDFNDKVIIVDKLKIDFANTPYSSRASIYLGNIYQKNKDFDKAKENYRWAGENAIEKSIASLANYQYASMLLIQGSYDDSLLYANKINDFGFFGLKADLLGDINAKLEKKDEARNFYKQALDFYKDKNDLAKVIKIKLDALN